jgi:putative aldouronate transport system substrate-binding protein
MKKLRMVALFLVLAICLLLVSGCGSGTTTTQSDTSSETATATTTAEETTDAAQTEEAPSDTTDTAVPAESAAAEEAPVEEAAAEPALPGISLLSDDPITLSMFITFPTEYLNYTGGWAENEAYKLMAEKTNVTIDFYQVPSGDNATYYNLLIAGGEYTDFIGGGVTEYENEVTRELSDLIENEMPNYKALLDSNPDYAKAATTDDGLRVGIFGFYAEGYPVPYGPVIRQDWLDALGLDTPVTYDDYHDVLTAFKTEYDCASPLFLACNGVPVGDYLIAGYGVAGFSNANTTQVPFYQVDGTVGYGPIEDGYYEYLTMIKQWYDEGLIDKDFATSGDFMFPSDDLIANDDVGIFYSFVARISSFSLVNEDPDLNIQPLADAVQEEGDVNHLRHINSLTAGSIGISTQCEYPEIAAQYLDAWFTDEGYMMANYGIEDLTYTVDEDGNVAFTDVILDNSDGLSFEMCLYKYCQYNGGIYFNNWERQVLAYTDAQMASIEIWNTSDYDYGFSSDITMTAEETENFNAAYSDIKTYVAETTLKFILGSIPLDESHWNEYVETVKSMGIDTCIAIKQDSVTRYLNRA